MTGSLNDWPYWNKRRHQEISRLLSRTHYVMNPASNKLSEKASALAHLVFGGRWHRHYQPGT